MVFRERCLDSLYDVFEECNKRHYSLERSRKEANEECETDTQGLKRRVDQIDDFLQMEIERLRAHLKEGLSVVQEAAGARTKQIEWKIYTLEKQASQEIARIQMSSPGRSFLEEFIYAECHILHGSSMKEARSLYLNAYEEAIKTHEASLMAEDMELVALHLSWRTERVNSMGECNLDLDEKWVQRIRLCRQRATPVRIAYEASKTTCRDYLKSGVAAAANEISKRCNARLKESALETDTQKHVDAINKKRDQKIARLQAKIGETEEKRRRQAEELRNAHKAQRSSLMDSVHTLKQSLSFAIKERQAVLSRECDVISKDLRAVQATLTLVTSAIHTLGQDPTSRPGSGMCPCGCGGRRRPSHRDRRPNGTFRDSFTHFPSSDSRQRTYKRFEEQWRADESRRQHEVHEEAQRRYEERLKREREARRRKEEAEERARTEREARARFEREQREEQDTAEREEEAHRKREERRKAERDARAQFEREQARAREEEDTRKREEEARRKRENEERQKAEEDHQAKEEEKRRQREEEEARKQAEEEERRRESARKREEEESRRKEEERRRREDDDRQNHHKQQQGNSHGGGKARSSTGEGGIDDDDIPGGTSSDSTSKGGPSFVHKLWAKYTEMWTRLMASAVSKIKLQEIPWPISLPGKRLLTNMSIADILFRINKESIRSFLLAPAQLQSMSSKARIRKELLRFHPDKRVLWLKNVKDEEREQVDKACEQVVLHLTDLLNTTT